MNITLYHSLDNHNVINKRKVMVDSYEINLKKQTNILNPIIPLYIDTELPAVDYAYINDLNRYYHVINIEPKPNKVYILQLEVDVLETYKEEILNAKKVSYINSVKPNISILKSDYVATDEISYVLSTLSGDIVERG